MPTPRVPGEQHVIAMDPGGRSGWASARMSENRFEFTGSGVLRQDLMADWFAEKQNLLDSEGAPGYGKTFTVMVYETWYPRPDENGKMDWIKGDPLLSAQHVGQLRWIAKVTGTKVVAQHPSDKPMATRVMPEVFRTLDQDSNEQHDQDARMHLWLYFWRNWFTGKMKPEKTVVL